MQPTPNGKLCQHARRTYRKRYGKPLSRHDYLILCWELQNHKRQHALVCPVSKGRLLIAFYYRRDWVYAIYEPQSGWVVTFYTEKMAQQKVKAS